VTRRDIPVLVLLVSGFTAWSAGFVLIYALQALGCAYGWPLHRLILIAAYIFTLVPLATLALPRRPAAERPESPLETAALWVNRAALTAGILVFFPVAFTSICI
jgi:hypothetical protein